MSAFSGPKLDGEYDDDNDHASDEDSFQLSDAAQNAMHDIFKDLDRNLDGKLQISEIKASPICQLYFTSSTSQPACVPRADST